jgi:catechol 2,3-dioxygenase-like lactoylglutathione lyase family enzyme
MMRFDRVTLDVRDLNGLAAFYRDGFGLDVAVGAEAVEVHVGAGTLCFQRDAAEGGQHHYAIDLPPFRFADAVTWLAKRAVLLKTPDGAQITHSDDWDAESVYFHDPAGNIGELIARNTRTVAADGLPFGPKDLLCISEVGLVVPGASDVTRVAQRVMTATGARSYGDVGPMFHPVGEVTDVSAALFILVPEGRLWFPERREPAQVAHVQVAGHGPAGEFTLDSAVHGRA